MQAYIALMNFTEQGIRAIDQSPARADAFRDMAASIGANVKEVFWTTGAHDGVLILEAPDDAAASAALLALAKAGNVRTQTLRAYPRGEFEKIVASMP